jgi:two-component system sensor histidine kinase TctE
MVWLTKKPRGSIQFWLLVLLMPGVISLLLLDSWNDYKVLASVTEVAYDSALLEPAKVLETSVEFNPDGSLRIDPPFYAQVMLESRAGNRKYFRVEEIVPPLETLAGAQGGDIKGVTLVGMQSLPRPKMLSLAEGTPIFYNGFYRNDEVRMVALWRDLYYKGERKQILVLVGESIDMRLDTLQQAWREGLFRDGRMFLLAIFLVWFSVQWALRPLNQLRREIRARAVNNLMPLDVADVPAEVVPLVKSINHHIELYRQVLDKQEQFLVDASHQLRTPLAIMRTQAQYAKREPDIERMRDTLTAIIEQLQQTTRLTEQLLSLAHARSNDSGPQARVDIKALARQVVLQYLPLAREKKQDLGWLDHDEQRSAYPSQTRIWVLGSDAELHEAIANLVHNAINHAGYGTTITVSVGSDDDYAWVSVSDNGVGLDPSLRESVFVRFDRGGSARKSLRGSGSGLGLAIARAYAERNNATIVLEDGDPSENGGMGLRAVLRIPRFPG